MTSITDTATQYADSRKLAARARLHRESTVAETPWFAWVARHLPLAPGAKVLDVGCGPGWFWAGAARDLPDGIDLTLLDQSAGMVEEAVARCTPLPFASVDGITADAATLPVASDSVDIVVAMHMLYHVPDQAGAIAEMVRVLRPGGTLAITTNGIDNLRDLYALTTVFGSDPSDPAGAIFGFDRAETLMRDALGNVTVSHHPSRLRVTDPDIVFDALTSYPPGDGAPQDQLTAFRAAIDAAFAAGGGVLETANQRAVFVGRKPN